MKQTGTLAPEKKAAAASKSKAPPLAHVPTQVSFQLATSAPPSNPLEKQADAAAAAVTGGTPGSGPASTSSSVLGLLVDDGVAPGPGQMARGVFLSEISTEIERVADAELTKVGRTARDCPYLAHWLEYYRTRNAMQVERAIQQYANPTGRDLASVRQSVLVKVQSTVQTWITTHGRVIEAPSGIDFPAVTDPVSQLTAVAPSFQRSAASQSAAGPEDPGTVLGQLGPGRALSGPVSDRMQEGFGQDLSTVRLHDDAGSSTLASQYQARAFTVGQHIAFGPGEYRPGTIAGEALLAHEIAHTLQQRGATAPAAGAQHGLEQSADRAAEGALLLRPEPAGGAGGLRLQRCGGSKLPDKTIDWQDVGKSEYDQAVKRIRELHDEEKLLIGKPGWDESRSDQLLKIQNDIGVQLKILQDLGVRRDSPEILQLLLQDAPADLRQVTGRIQGGSDSIYRGEQRQMVLILDYLPKTVDWWVQWTFQPNRADENPLVQDAKPQKAMTLPLDAGFWASYDHFGGSPDPAAFRTEKPGFAIVANLFLGSQGEPAAVFTTPFMKLTEEVPKAVTIEAPRLLSLPTPGAPAPPAGQPPPTTTYVMKDASADFTLNWSPQAIFSASPKYALQWWLQQPGEPAPDEQIPMQKWSATINFKKVGPHTVGAKVFQWDQGPDSTPILKATKSVECVTHEDLGSKLLAEAEKQPAGDYQNYLKELDTQTTETEETAKAGTIAPRAMGERLSQLKEMRGKVAEQVGAKGATQPFPETETGFRNNVVYVASMPAVLSAPELSGAFPLTVFVTMRLKDDGSYSARITDATTQDVIGWPRTGSSGSSAKEALNNAIKEWHDANEYPIGGSLHYSFNACGWNFKASFGTTTFKKQFWSWFDRIVFIATAAVLLLLPFFPVLKVVGMALLVVGILRSAINIWNNWQLGRPKLDQRNVLEAINIVASLAGLKGGLMMASAQKGVALGEALTGEALTTFNYGKGVVAMTAALDVGTFVYISADAISQLQAVQDPSVPEGERDARMADTFLRLMGQFALIIGSNSHIFSGAKPRGTNLGLFLDKVSPNSEIRLDPSMRTRLIAEYRKINKDADVSSLTDRDLVMGLRAIRNRGQVLKSLKEIRDSLDAKGRAAFDRKRDEFKSPEDFHESLQSVGDLKEYFAKLAADPTFGSRKPGPDMPFAEQLQRAQSLDPHSKVERAPSKGLVAHDAGVEIAPDDQIRINGQIDIHPEALKSLTEDELKVLLEATRQIREGGGKPTKDQEKALSKFTATAGYRYRFEFQHEEALKQLDELGIKANPLFAELTPEGRAWLLEMKGVRNPEGVSSMRKQAADWALGRNPTSVPEFVQLFQYYASAFTKRVNAKLGTYTAALEREMASPGATTKTAQAAAKKSLGITGNPEKFYGAQVEAEMGSADKAKPSDAVRAQLNDSFGNLLKDPAAAVTSTKVDPALRGDQLVAKVRESKNLTFGSSTETAYHTEKHMGDDVPADSGSGSTPVAAYVDSARQTIAQGTLAKQPTPGQYGGTHLHFQREVSPVGGGKKTTLNVFVYVSVDGNVSILTMYGVKE